MHDPSGSGSEDPPSRRDGLIGWLRQRFRGSADQSLRRSLEDAIEEHEDARVEEEGDIGEEELAMLRNLLSNGGLRLDEVMVRRADIVAFDIDNAFDDLIAEFIKAAHSRVPIYRESLDNVVGMVHIKDVIGPLAGHGGDQGPPSIASLLRSVLFVPPSMRVIDLLVKMRASRTHMAIVVDEYGGTDGLVTIEDLVEQFVGDIEDEHDSLDPNPIRKLGDGWIEADARAPIDDVSQALEVDLLEGRREDDIETVAGIIYALAGRVPLIGEIVEHDSGVKFEIVDGDPRKIKGVRVYAPEVEPGEGAA